MIKIIIIIICISQFNSSILSIDLGKSVIDGLIDSNLPNIYEKITNKVNSIKEIKGNIKIKSLTIESFEFFAFSLNNLTYNKNDLEIKVPNQDNKIDISLHNLDINLSLKYNINRLLFPKRNKKIDLILNAKVDIELAIISKDNLNILQVSNIKIIHKIKKLRIQDNFILSKIIKNKYINKIIDIQLEKIISSSINKILQNTFLNLAKKGLPLPMENNHISLIKLQSINYQDDSIYANVDIDIQKKSSSEEGFELIRHIKSNIRNDNNEDFIKMILSQDLINSYINSIFEENKLIFNMNDNTIPIPSSIPFKFNTSYFSKVIPCIYSKFPNQDLNIRIKSKTSPIIKIDNTRNSINISAYISMDYLLLNDLTVNTVGFNTQLELSLSFLNKDPKNKIYVNINSISLSNTIVTQKCGLTNGSIFEKAFNLLSSSFIQTVNSNILNNGINIPSKKINEIEITVQKNNTQLEIGIIPNLNN